MEFFTTAILADIPLLQLFMENQQDQPVNRLARVKFKPGAVTRRKPAEDPAEKETKPHEKKQRERKPRKKEEQQVTGIFAAGLGTKGVTSKAAVTTRTQPTLSRLVRKDAAIPSISSGCSVDDQHAIVASVDMDIDSIPTGMTPTSLEPDHAQRSEELDENALLLFQFPPVFPRFDLSQSSEGRIGELVIRESGQIEIEIGEMSFIVTKTSGHHFAENVVVADHHTRLLVNYGQLTHMYKCKPVE